MFFDCKIILGGYVRAHLKDHMKQIRSMVATRDPFDDNADFLEACTIKRWYGTSTLRIRAWCLDMAVVLSE